MFGSSFISASFMLYLYLYAKYENKSRHVRNLTVAGGVLAATLVTPVLAAFAVGIGVPILLAYVYGVVPISMCRAGGCGSSQNDVENPKFDFDESADVATAAPGPSHAGELKM